MAGESWCAVRGVRIVIVAVRCLHILRRGCEVLAIVMADQRATGTGGIMPGHDSGGLPSQFVGGFPCCQCPEFRKRDLIFRPFR